MVSTIESGSRDKSGEGRGAKDREVLTVKVGFSIGNEVELSDKDVDDASAPSSMSSAALTEPRKATDVQSAVATTPLNRMVSTSK